MIDEPANLFSADFCLLLGINLDPCTEAFIACAIEKGNCFVCWLVHLVACGSCDFISNLIDIRKE